MATLDNREIARQLRETADLMEVAGEDGFRIRSYRKAADVVDTCPESIAALCLEPSRLQALPGIGKTLSGHIIELVTTGHLRLREDLLSRYQPGMLDLLQVQGLGPKTAALIWATYGAGNLDAVEALAKEGKLRLLPRMGEKAEQRILQGIQAYRALSGRFRRDQIEEAIALIIPWLRSAPGVTTVEATGSWRRGRDTVGDLDLLLAGPGFPDTGAVVVERCATLPRQEAVLAEGPNKVSVRLHGGLQVDMRLLPPESFGAALQYFTGSQQHNIALRARAQQQGLKLNEYGLFRESDGARLAGVTEAEIYQQLGLDWIPPELREAAGELELAQAHALPHLIAAADLRGDIHMHTVASDGRASIEEMAEAAAHRGYQYIAITEHSKALAMANGLDERRLLEHRDRIRAAEAHFQKTHPGFRILAGVEVDILADGRLDLEDAALAELDVVIGSIHSHFSQSTEVTTERILRAVDNSNLDILGHPTGRLLLRREPYQYDFERVLAAVAAAGVVMEINASPERLDLDATHAHRCRQLAIPIVINTDAHHPQHLANIRFGISTARRAWLEPANVLNTLPAEALLRRLRAT